LNPSFNPTRHQIPARHERAESDFSIQPDPVAGGGNLAGYESIAAHTGVKIVGPQITWGTMTGFTDPVVWMDAFIAAYKAANGGRAPQID
jgi:hypothetical protein